MLKKLAPIGNSLGLVIDRPILELLRIDRDTVLDVRTDGDRLVIEPVRPDVGGVDPVREMTERMIAAHRDTLTKLAR